VQDVASDVKAIRAGLQSRSSTILGRGDDPEQVDAEIAEDDKRAEGYGLVLESNAKHVSNAGVTQARPEGTTLPNGDSVANTDEE
jgi:capsid protein